MSAIIPTYNRSALLPRAILSVCRQSMPVAEILVVDDGSTDDTRAVTAALRHLCQVPIRYFHQENRGPGSARNTGIVQAACPFLAFLDSDDHWHPEKISRQFKTLAEQPEYLISHTGEQWLRRGSPLKQRTLHRPRQGDIFDHCLQLCAVGMSTVLVRRELFAATGMFDPVYPCCEDYDLWLRVSAEFSFLLVAEPLTIKEGGREDQLSVRLRVGMDKYRIQAIKTLLDSGKLDHRQRQAALLELQRKATIYGKGCIKHGREQEGQRYLEMAATCAKEAAQ